MKYPIGKPTSNLVAVLPPTPNPAPGRKSTPSGTDLTSLSIYVKLKKIF